MNEEKQSKPKLSQPQLETLVARTGVSEADSRKIFEQMQDKFPGNGLTKKIFCDIFYSSDDEEPSGAEIQEDNFYERLFYAIDHRHSGKIDLYDYVMIAALLEGDDPQVSIECLFRFCDADHDGFVTNSDISKTLFIFFMNSVDDDVETLGQNEDECLPDEIVTVMREAFDGKAQLSEPEFVKLWTESDQLKGIAKMINEKVAIALATVTGTFIE